jgi:AraC-like DNA-binding protein
MVLYDRRVLDTPREWVRAWKPQVPGIHEVLHASFAGHAYPPHTHDAWTVFIVDRGAVRYDLESRHRGAAGRRITILPPHVTHDGRAAATTGYRKRVLYVGEDVLGERLIGRAVDRPDIEDPAIVLGFEAVHRALRDPDGTLEAESHLALMAERIRRRLGGVGDDPPLVGGDALATSLRDLLDDRSRETPTLAEAGVFLHASPSQLVRSFTRTFGIAPHRYVVGRRIDAARRLLLDGVPLARAAVDAGFHDQAHMTRHFRRHVGVTPGRYVASSTRR